MLNKVQNLNNYIIYLLYNLMTGRQTTFRFYCQLIMETDIQVLLTLAGFIPVLLTLTSFSNHMHQKSFLCMAC